jgi:hypothetical protein
MGTAMDANKGPDLLVLFATLLALVFSPRLSAVLAPYAVIIVGALLGVGWGLKRRPIDSKSGKWSFVALMLGTALVFTMPAALLLERYLGAASYQWMLAPLAALIGAVGNDWPSVGSWLAQAFGRLITRKVEGN